MTPPRQGTDEAMPRTARRTASRQQRASGPALASFGELFENASDIILLNDREGRVVAANRAAREFGGYSAEEVARGIHLRDVLAPADCEAAMLLTQRALDGLPIPEVYEREAVLRDGSHRRVELRSNVLRRSGQAPLLQTIGRDVTEQKESAAFHASLLQVSQALLTAQSLDELGRVICEEAGRVLHVDGAYLWLRRDDVLMGCAAAGRNAGEFVGIRRSLQDSFIGQMYRASDVLVVNDFQHSLYGSEPARRFGVQALLAAPLRRGGAPLGVLVFTDTVNPRRFTGTLRERALIFAAQTTVAIESALAREREEEEGLISTALFRVSRALRESLEEHAVVREIARGARTAVRADWSFVSLYDEHSGALRVAVTEGWPTETAAELQLVDFHPQHYPELQPLLAHQTVEVREPPRDELYARWQVSSFMSVPMVRANRLIGAVTIGYRERRGPFSARQRRIGEGIALQAAVAVENARLVADLQRANRLKSEFLGTMSHELRTPLNAILGYADLMRDGALGAVGTEQEEALARILINGRALLELINMTLDVNRLEAGRVTVSAAEFSLDDLFAELRNEFGVRARAGVTLSWPDRMARPNLFTDHGKLKAVLRNLVDNALKYTEHGSVTVRVNEVSAERIAVAVQDTGVGIPDSALGSIFDMFRQLDGALRPARGGVGLGLYVVRRYTELLGGSVTVDSVVGNGSAFTVEIPRQLAST